MKTKTELSPWSPPQEPTQAQLRLAKALPYLVLASASPARRMELANAGITVAVRPTDADEQVSQTIPYEKVMAITRRKMDAYLMRAEHELPVLTCDTMIAHNGKMIGKPTDRLDAYRQLKSFSGAAHEVYTGWALAFSSGTLRLSPRFRSADKAHPQYFHEHRDASEIEIVWYYDYARVEFHPLSDQDIETYLDCDEWKGAAGSYRIQGRGSSLVKSIHGDYATVVGLPISMISGIVSDTAFC